MNAESPGIAYRVFSLLLLPFWLLHAYLHGRKHSQSDYSRRRLSPGNRVFEAPVIWIHAASVGEVMAVTPLVKALIKDDEKILMTSFTATGFQTIQRVLGDEVDCTVIPVDFLLCCRRFVKQYKIKLCLLMETELWPELLYQVANRSIPIIQINARLSRKSTDAPIFVRYLLRRALANIRLHLARNQHDKQLLVGLGAENQNIKVIGNLKNRLDSGQNFEKLIDRDYILLASTHEGEEALFFEHRKPINELVVIAPRHPKRSEAIQQEMSAKGIKYSVRSRNDELQEDTEVYLADTLGELKSLMAHAKLVIMGGSFDRTGGHNLIEPASLGCAIITGPSDSNIVDDIRQLADGVIQVGDMAECWDRLDYLLDNPAEARELGKRVLRKLQDQGDVVEDYLHEIRPFLKESTP